MFSWSSGCGGQQVPKRFNSAERAAGPEAATSASFTSGWTCARREGAIAEPRML